jgi:primosomal protein N' (replication factor Y)
VNNAGIELANRLRQAPALKNQKGTMILGPDKPAVARVKTLCIRKIVLKLDLSLSLKAVRDNIKFCVLQMMTDANYKSLLVHYDVDPS